MRILAEAGGIGKEFVLVEFAGENVHFFCLFVTHAIIVSCDSLDTHKHSHSINLSLKGLHCKMTPIDGCSSSSGYTLFLNRDFLASILCD